MPVNAKSRPEPIHRDCARRAREQRQAECAAQPRGPWRIVDGQLKCKRGHVIAGDADIVFTQGRRRCRACHRARNSRSARSITAARQLARARHACLNCGMAVPADRRKFCSHPCCIRANGRIAGDRERAALAGVAFEPVYLWPVWERDGGLCQLCGLPVLWFLEWPHGGSAVLDHEVPLSQGGDHVAANLQLAHAVCNGWKATLGPAEFERKLTLIGLGQWGPVMLSA